MRPFVCGQVCASFSHTLAATFHSTFTSVISWRTNMHKAQYVLHIVEWNSVWTDIVSTKYNVGSQEKGAKCTFGQKSLFAIFGSVKGVCTLCQKILHGFAIGLKLLINSQKS